MNFWAKACYGAIGLGVFLVLATGGKEAVSTIEKSSKARSVYTKGLSDIENQTQDLKGEGKTALKMVKTFGCRPARAMSLDKQIGGKRGWNKTALSVGQIATIDGKREEAFPEGYICTEDGQIASVGADGRILNPLGDKSLSPTQIPKVPLEDMAEFLRIYQYAKQMPGPEAVASSESELKFLRQEERAAGLNIDSSPQTSQESQEPVNPIVPEPGVSPPVTGDVPDPERSPDTQKPPVVPQFSQPGIQGSLPQVKVD